MHLIQDENTRIKESVGRHYRTLMAAVLLSIFGGVAGAQSLQCGGAPVESTARWNEQCFPGFPSNCQICTGTSEGDPIEFVLEEASVVAFNLDNLARYPLSLFVEGTEEGSPSYYRLLENSLSFSLHLPEGVYAITGNGSYTFSCGQDDSVLRLPPP